jgi:hypothetical protein
VFEAGAEEECSFLKKRTKKLLCGLSRACPASARQRIKSFLLLFFKKEDSSGQYDEGSSRLALCK